MNLILLEETDRVSDTHFRLTGKRAKHVREVLRAEVGRELRIGLLDGPLGTGRIAPKTGRIRAPGSSGEQTPPPEGDGEPPVELECVFEVAPPPRPRVDLLLAIPRPKSLLRLLPEVTAVGIDRLTLFRTWRVQKPYLTAQVLAPEVYRPLLHEGLMQGRCTREPRVSVEPVFKPFVEDRLPGFLNGARGLVAHPEAPIDLADVSIAEEERVVLAIGPEGGFIQYEIDALAKAGLTPVRLGRRRLRVETACVAALAQVDLLRKLPRDGAARRAAPAAQRGSPNT